MSEGAVIGLDFTAALAVGDALGVDRLAIAELMPSVEAGLVAGANERLRSERGRETG